MKRLKSVSDRDMDTHDGVTNDALENWGVVPFETETTPSITLSRPELTALGGIASTLISMDSELFDDIADIVDTPELAPENSTFSKDENTLIQILLDHPGESLSMVEFKHMGGFDSTIHTRYALHRLIKTVHNASNKEVISVLGKTKGTKYMLPLQNIGQLVMLRNLSDHAQEADVELEVDKKKHETRLQIREAKVQKLVARYKDHRLVKNTLQFAKNPLRKPPHSIDVMKAYLDGLKEYDLLTADDEKILFFNLDRSLELADSISDREPSMPEEFVLIQGAIAHELLFRSNTRLAVRFSKQYWNKGLDSMDVIQEANKGLMSAIARFDIERQTKFSTYATYWIKQACSRALDNMSRAIRIPTHKADEIKRTFTIVTSKQTELERNLTNDEMLKLVGMTTQEYTQLLEVNRPSYVYLDALIDEDGGDKHDIFMHNSEPIETTAIRNESHSLLAEFIAKADITDLQRMVIGLRTAIEPDILPDLKVTLPNGKVLTYAAVMAQTQASNGRDLMEVAQILGIDRFKVRSLESRAMATLKTLSDPRVNASA